MRDKLMQKIKVARIERLIIDLEQWGDELQGIVRSGYSQSMSEGSGGGFASRIPKGVKFSHRWFKRLSMAIEDIDDRSREYIELRFIGMRRDSDPKPLKNQEIAEVKGVHVRTVERNLSAAYEQILKNRKKYYHYPIQELDTMSLIS